jgi:hypothetical protein
LHVSESLDPANATGLKPLNAGGIRLAVIITPPTALVFNANDTDGVASASALKSL